jgi:hypothetical protein
VIVSSKVSIFSLYNEHETSWHAPTNDLFLESPNFVVANPNLVVENPSLLVGNPNLLVGNRDLLVGNRNLLAGNLFDRKYFGLKSYLLVVAGSSTGVTISVAQSFKITQSTLPHPSG